MDSYGTIKIQINSTMVAANCNFPTLWVFSRAPDFLPTAGFEQKNKNSRHFFFWKMTRKGHRFIWDHQNQYKWHYGRWKLQFSHALRFFPTLPTFFPTVWIACIIRYTMSFPEHICFLVSDTNFWRNNQLSHGLLSVGKKWAWPWSVGKFIFKKIFFEK